MNNSFAKAQQLLSECGFDEITDIEMGLFVSGLGATLIEEKMSYCEGKIIFGTKKAIIKVNSEIQYQERKRYVIGHEIGHLILHRNLQLPDDTFMRLNIFKGMEQHLQFGKQELEANEFASELLMPTKIILSYLQRKRFSPLLIKQISERFKTGLTATLFRYINLDLHPICIVFIENGIVKYWKKSDGMNVWLKEITRLGPPEDSVAFEYLQNDYAALYKIEDNPQVIQKSTWFKLGLYDHDTDFYEFCISSKLYKTIVSIIWED